jgi:hypothetical protein
MAPGTRSASRTFAITGSRDPLSTASTDRHIGRERRFAGTLILAAALLAACTLLGEQPTSSPAPHGVRVPFVTGHCGVGSPIDFDGSFWDAVGEGRIPEDWLGAYEGTIEITNPSTAVFRSIDGRVTIPLTRHVGMKSFQGCV